MNQVFKNPLLSFPEILLRGVGQVFFQNNPWTGLIIIDSIGKSRTRGPFQRPRKGWSRYPCAS